ncbi:MAG: hypothetical protein M3268_02055 [Acidobacteriota bacterium]|nr:hypothetical protein [Acidobacteriota bacterium]
MKRLVIAACVPLLFAAGAFAQCHTGAPSRVSFERGKASAEVNGEMPISGEACYTLRARAGQQMSVSVSSAHDYARFNIFPPSKDHTIAHETSGWSGVLPETGDYVIALYPRANDEAGSFTLFVSIKAATTPATSGGAGGGATGSTGGASSSSGDKAASSDNSSAAGAGAQPYTFDAGEGAYVFDGRPPKGFEELTALELPGVLLRLSADGAGVVSVSTDPQGWVDTRGGRQFKSKSATINGDEITFETEAVRGVSYQFTGRFYKKDVDKGQLLDATLKGRLVKFVNGRKVAEAQLNLYQAVGG